MIVLSNPARGFLRYKDTILFEGILYFMFFFFFFYQKHLRLDCMALEHHFQSLRNIALQYGSTPYILIKSESSLGSFLPQTIQLCCIIIAARSPTAQATDTEKEWVSLLMVLILLI